MKDDDPQIRKQFSARDSCGKNVSSIELLEDAGCLTLDFEDGSSLVLETFLKKGVRVVLKKTGKAVVMLEND